MLTGRRSTTSSWSRRLCPRWATMATPGTSTTTPRLTGARCPASPTGSSGCLMTSKKSGSFCENEINFADNSFWWRTNLNATLQKTWKKTNIDPALCIIWFIWRIPMGQTLLFTVVVISLILSRHTLLFATFGFPSLCILHVYFIYILYYLFYVQYIKAIL